MKIIIPGILLCLLTACTPETAVVETDHSVTCFSLPTGTHLPRLAADEHRLYLSYVRQQADSNQLERLEWRGNLWSAPDVIASGKNWFVNWADFPSVVPYGGQDNNRLFAHWLQYSGAGTYDYDIRFLTRFLGQSAPPAILHQDGVAAEHGFLSSALLPDNDLQLTWLDGRNTKEVGAAAGAMEGHEHGHGGGAMSLRTKALSDTSSIELDNRVCDCCNTATIATDQLTMVVYRDRSEAEIRDISFVVNKGGGWSSPKAVHIDGWQITGCPVNGPALASNGAGNIAVIWYTAPRDRAQVLFSRYDTATDTWAPPTLLDDDTPLGRVDLQLADDGTAYATALTSKPGTDDAFLTLWNISPTGDIRREDLATTSAARSAGFPKTALFKDRLFWARTVIGAEKGEQFVEICWRY